LPCSTTEHNLTEHDAAVPVQESDPIINEGNMQNLLSMPCHNLIPCWPKYCCKICCMQTKVNMQYQTFDLNMTIGIDCRPKDFYKIA